MFMFVTVGHTGIRFERYCNFGLPVEGVVLKLVMLGQSRIRFERLCLFIVCVCGNPLLRITI